MSARTRPAAPLPASGSVQIAPLVNIDSSRMVIRIEQGKRGRDRYVMRRQLGSMTQTAPSPRFGLRRICRVAPMEDATSELYSAFLVDEEGTASSLRGVREVVAQHGLFCSLYTDRGSHYFETPEAGVRVCRRRC